MGSYGAAQFAKAAAKLPSGLAVQLRKQLGITPEQFLAAGQAGADAGKVVAALRADGVTVYGAKLSGTALTVTVRDAAGATAAEAAGANAVIGTAQPVKTVKAKALTSPADGTSHLLGGDLWFYFTNLSAGEGVECSTGFNGYNQGTGAREFLTAGHCADYLDTGGPAPANGVVYAATDEKPADMNDGVPAVLTQALGSLNQSSFRFGGKAHSDSGIVNVTDAKATPAPAVNTWGSGDTSAGTSSTASQGVENGGKTVPVLGAAAAFSGEPVCHSGARTGWQCGVVDNGGGSYVTAEVPAATGTQLVDGFDTSVCDLPGDSGGSFVSGEYAVGMASAGSFNPQSTSGLGYNSCAADGDTIAYPMVAAESGEDSAALSQPGFELAVSVPVPVISTATTNIVTATGTISGYLPRPFATGTPVSLTLDGHQAASTTADSSGNWSFSLAQLTPGAHPYTVTAGSGHSTAAKSGTLSLGVVTIGGTPQVGRALTATVTGVPSDGRIAAVQWYLNSTVVQTNGPYLIPASAVGQAVSVSMFISEGNDAVSVGSGRLTIAPGTIINFTEPKVTGAVRAGLKVPAYPGTWSAGSTFTYQWLANGRPISGATGASYIVPASLPGAKLSVTVTAHMAGYTNAARTSAAILVGKGIFILKVRPALSGTPIVGRRLAVTAGTWSPAAAVRFQWYANGVPVSRATGTSLLLTSAMRGKVVSVIISASKPGYATAALRVTESAKVR
jgi:hypothetical protein